MRFKFLLGDFKDPEQSKGSEDGEAEGAGHLDEVRPANLEDRGQDHDAVEPVETGFEVDPRPQGVHPNDHLRDEEPEKDEFGVVCKKEKPKSRVILLGKVQRGIFKSGNRVRSNFRKAIFEGCVQSGNLHRNRM